MIAVRVPRETARFLFILILLLVPRVLLAVEVGDIAPQINLPALAEPARTVTTAEHRDKVLFVDFWSAWCAPCRRALPDLAQLRADFPRAEFEIVSVNLDLVPGDARRVLAEQPPEYPVVMDPAGVSADAYGVTILPSIFLIDREGVVRQAFSGAHGPAFPELQGMVADLIANGTAHEEGKL
jgi:thiol-disulfide isomerase/thioredoxin